MKRVCFFLGAALLGCSARSDLRAGNGELGHGEFAYACTTPADAFCRGEHDLLPEAVAVGAEFRVSFRSLPANEEFRPTTATDEAVSWSDDGRVHIRRAGTVSFIVQKGGALFDYVDVRARDVAFIDVPELTAASTTMDLDASLAVHAVLQDDTRMRLFGSLALSWESSDPSIVAVETSAADATRGGATLNAKGVGAARIRVVAGTTFREIEIRVSGSRVPPKARAA